MNVPNEDLDGWRAAAMEAGGVILGIDRAIERSNTDQARTLVGKAYDLTSGLVHRMDAAGAQATYEKPSQCVPLELLDTPASRAYLATLIAAREAAIVMDAERYGRDMAEDCSTPSAGMIDLMVCGMETDIFGVSEERSERAGAE